jgi:hypothetical protein
MIGFKLNYSFTQNGEDRKNWRSEAFAFITGFSSEEKENQKNLGITAIESCSVIGVPV